MARRLSVIAIPGGRAEDVVAGRFPAAMRLQAAPSQLNNDFLNGLLKEHILYGHKNGYRSPLDARAKEVDTKC